MKKSKLKKREPKSLLGKFKKGFRQLKTKTEDAGGAISKAWDENKDDIQRNAGQAVEKGKQIVGEAVERATETDAAKGGIDLIGGAIDGATEVATDAYHSVKYSESELNKLEKNIENQGGRYRELNRDLLKSDIVMIGGESLVSLLAIGNIPDEIINAYEAAYPVESLDVSFIEKVKELQGLDDSALTGFISGVKGKLFEQKYVGYLNDGNLPEGYEAVLAESATQPGWDIAIEGEEGEVVEVLQAKATDSVSYINEALEKYPNIDVVTTDEVYSHLVMSGVNEDISNSSISNFELVNAIEGSVDEVDIPFDLSLPVFTIAFIAFTSYKDESLDALMKLRNAGERSAKAYLSFIAGAGVGAVTNTWWLGVVGSVGSRMLCDRGKIKQEVYVKLKKTEEANQVIIDKMKRTLSEAAGT